MKADVGTAIYAVTDRETGTEFIVDGAGQIEGPEEAIRRLGDAVSCVTPLEETAGSDDVPDAVTQAKDDHWRTVKAAVEAGEYDEHLEELAETELPDAKAEAVAERMQALSESESA